MAFDEPGVPGCIRPLAERRPVAVDLFCGIGGMGLGFEQAGFDVIAAVDHDPLLAAVHEFNHPNTAIICADVAALVGTARDQLRIGDRALDVVFGGPPCQGFSSIGKRQPDDPRNTLVSAFAKVAVELNPQYVVMENVAGLAHRPMRVHLDRAKEVFERAGYQVADAVVADAASYGVPQRRKRVFLLAWRVGSVPLAMPDPTHGDREGLSPLVTVEKAIRDLAARMPLRRSSYAMSLDRAQTFRSAARHGSPAALTGLEATNHTPETVARYAGVQQGAEDPISRYTRLRWAGQCHTMRAGTGPDHGSFMSARPIHPDEPRVITVREAARLHGYPDWFQFHRTKWHSFRGIGNSVPPPMARALAMAIIDALGCQPTVVAPVRLNNKDLLAFDPSEAARWYSSAPPAKRRRPEKVVAKTLSHHK